MSTKQEIMDELDELEVEYDPKLKKAELEELLYEDEEEEEPAEEVEEVKEPIVKPVVKEKDLYAGKKIGLTTIVSSRIMDINGKKCMEIVLADGTSTRLSQEDLKKQVK